MSGVDRLKRVGEFLSYEETHIAIGRFAISGAGGFLVSANWAPDARFVGTYPGWVGIATGLFVASESAISGVRHFRKALDEFSQRHLHQVSKTDHEDIDF